MQESRKASDYGPTYWISAFAEMTDAVNKGYKADSHRKCKDLLDVYVSLQ
ncbi:MAG: hypothetical protein AB8G77_19150 [Rhodothermales bacterium]